MPGAAHHNFMVRGSFDLSSLGKFAELLRCSGSAGGWIGAIEVSPRSDSDIAPTGITFPVLEDSSGGRARTSLFRRSRMENAAGGTFNATRLDVSGVAGGP